MPGALGPSAVHKALCRLVVVVPSDHGSPEENLSSVVLPFLSTPVLDAYSTIGQFWSIMVVQQDFTLEMVVAEQIDKVKVK